MESDSIAPPSTDFQARLDRLERRFDSYVGQPPDAISGRSGSGLVQAVLDIRKDFAVLGDRLAKLTGVFEADIASRNKEAAERAARREPFSKAAWIAIGSAIGLVTHQILSGVVLPWMLHR